MVSEHGCKEIALVVSKYGCDRVNVDNGCKWALLRCNLLFCPYVCPFQFSVTASSVSRSEDSRFLSLFLDFILNYMAPCSTSQYLQTTRSFNVPQYR
jgi:hypothetical protein